ncbi:putative reverse transcriptase domain-containing protein, partial [Tanacetum coccineum]
VKAKHGDSRPSEGYERVLWGDLKVMFEPHVEDLIYMLVEKKYPLTPPTLIDMLNKKGRIVKIQRLLDAVQDAAAQAHGQSLYYSSLKLILSSVVSRKVTTAEVLKILQKKRVLQDKVVEEITAGWDISHVKTVGHDTTYGMPWKTLMKKITNKYYLRSEIKKLEIEIWNLKVKGKCDICKPKTMQDPIELENDLMDQKLYTFTERHAVNKRKLENSNQAQQQLPKRQNVAQTYTIRSGEKKEYAGTLPLCNKCEFHYNGSCTVKCADYRKVGHLTRDCRNPTNTNQRTITCYECGNQGHYRSDYPELKNQNHGNQDGGKCDICKSKTMQDPIELANDLMDQKLYTFTERHAKNKRKLKNSNQAQQQLPKRQNVAQTYTIRSGEKKEYARTLLLCNKCEFHYNGLCTVKCANYRKVGHLTRDCRNPTNTN